jgi:hypothetical protein
VQAEGVVVGGAALVLVVGACLHACRHACLCSGVFDGVVFDRRTCL